VGGGGAVSRFAAQTSVSVEKSRAEIERTLMRYGASGFFSGFADDVAIVGFRISDRIVKIQMNMPARNSSEFTLSKRGLRSREVATQKWEQACRQRWRALALILKAKLEAVECGISTVEREFLADIVMPNGKSFGEWASPQIDDMYKTGGMPPLLGSGQ
jgi:hypothetical protein